MTCIFEKYGIHINKYTNILHIEKPILVKDFLELKMYLKTHRIKVKDIILGDDMHD